MFSQMSPISKVQFRKMNIKSKAKFHSNEILSELSLRIKDPIVQYLHGILYDMLAGTEIILIRYFNEIRLIPSSLLYI